MIKDANHRIDSIIYYYDCPHKNGISLDPNIPCRKCGDFIDSKQVGDFTICLLDNGEIRIDGGGYVGQ